MKVYTIENNRVTPGAVLYPRSESSRPNPRRTLFIGDGVRGQHVPLFNLNPAVVSKRSGKPCGDIITDAYPVSIENGANYALAKPHRVSDKILVVIITRTLGMTGYPGKRGGGCWTFDSKTTPTVDALKQTLVTASGPWRYLYTENSKSIGWSDALIIMKVSDIINVRDQRGEWVKVKYESVETGLIVDTRVRMILQDYDAAPDGVGTYIKLDSVFPSREAALHYRALYMANMYWGKIETLDGTLIESVEEREDHEFD
jgi:hypothetical protein